MMRAVGRPQQVSTGSEAEKAFTAVASVEAPLPAWLSPPPLRLPPFHIDGPLSTHPRMPATRDGTMKNACTPRRIGTSSFWVTAKTHATPHATSYKRGFLSGHTRASDCLAVFRGVADHGLLSTKRAYTVPSTETVKPSADPCPTTDSTDLPPASSDLNHRL